MGWAVWPKRIFFGMLIAFLFLALTACSGKWYGGGNVEGKEFHPPYMSYCGKGCMIYVPACHWLKVVEQNGNVHEGCVSQRVWEDAMLDHHINITPEYS